MKDYIQQLENKIIELESKISSLEVIIDKQQAENKGLQLDIKILKNKINIKECMIALYEAIIFKD